MDEMRHGPVSGTTAPNGGPSRRPRHHPARRARRRVGAASVGAVVLITGYLGVQSSTHAGTSPAETSMTDSTDTAVSTRVAATPAPAPAPTVHTVTSGS